MNPLEAQLDYPFGDTLPESGCLQRVAPGLFWLRMGLPFALNHINLWLLEDEIDGGDGPARGWTIVDCGIDDAATRAAWQTVIADQLQNGPILRVIATHCHPDHVGLAHWLCERWNAPLWMTAAEYAYARMMSAALPGADGTAAVPHFQKHGLSDASMLEQLRGRNRYFQTMVPAVPQAYTRLHDAQLLQIGVSIGSSGQAEKEAGGARRWRVITGCGHSPEHASLYCDELKILIAGDMVLPRISTNVSVFALEPLGNPLRLYLDSLEKFGDLPQDTLVLPAHGKPFRGLHTRIRQLKDHHAARLAEVITACVTPKSAADIVPLMFRRPLDTHQLSFALGEALAHLHLLWKEGKLRRQEGPDGVLRFVAA
jgi:glyoxylase-like metal-dependent hydrolase (beta-lactamase superfamily II)